MKWVKFIRQSSQNISTKICHYLYVHLGWKQIIFSEIDTQEGKIYRIDTQKEKYVKIYQKYQKN